MPWQTQSQQSYGNGSVQNRRLANLTAQGNPIMASLAPASGLQTSFANRFGGLTAAQVKAAQESGGAGPKGDVGGTFGMSMSPQGASAANSEMPGFFNGNDQPGVSKEQSGYAKPKLPGGAQSGGQTPSGPGMGMTGAGPSMGAALPQTAQTAGYNPSDPQTWYHKPVDLTVPPDPFSGALAGALTEPGKTREAAAPGTPGMETMGAMTPSAAENPIAAALSDPMATAATDASVGKTREASAPGAEAAITATSPYSYTMANGQKFPLTDKPPSGFASWDTARKNSWLKDHYWKAPETPAPTGEGATTTGGTTTGTGATTTTDPVTGVTTETTAATTATPAVDPTKADDRSAKAGYSGKPLNQYDMDTINLILDGGYQTGNVWGGKAWENIFGMTPQQAKEYGNLPNPTDANAGSRPMEQPLVINGIGIPQDVYWSNSPNYIPNQGVLDLVGYAATTARKINQLFSQPDDLTGVKQNQINDLTRTMNTAQAVLRRYGINYNPFSAAPGAEAESIYPSDPYQIPTYYQNLGGSMLPQDLMPLLNTGENMGIQDKLAALEYASAREEQTRANLKQQKAIDEAVSLKDANASDPQIQKYMDASNDMYDNPVLSDWEGIKNRTASDYAKDRTSSGTQLAEALAGRGLSASTGIGMQAQSNSQNRMGLSRAMGEMDVAQTDELRNQRQAGMAQLGEATQFGTGLRNMSSQQIQQLLMGQAPTAQNPAQGLGATAMNLYAAQMAKDAADEAGGSTSGWGAALGVVGGLVGTYFGGPAGGAMGSQLGTAVGGAI